MAALTTIGPAVACFGVLFFLVCAGLVFWYLFNQPKQEGSASAPEPPVQATIDHPTTTTEEPKTPSVNE